jgi:hypothetical protein
MTPPTHTTAPIQATGIAIVPEFVDAKGLRCIFGISRSQGYCLFDQGLVRTVCLRRPGTIRGKRLWDCESVRAYLRANMVEGRKQEPATSKAQAPALLHDPALEQFGAQNNELRARLAKIKKPPGVVT